QSLSQPPAGHCHASISSRHGCAAWLVTLQTHSRERGERPLYATSSSHSKHDGAAPQNKILQAKIGKRAETYNTAEPKIKGRVYILFRYALACGITHSVTTERDDDRPRKK
ncbi:hypothetical protein, partial [Microbispora hainanensis]|uniref:hypothetical protein n=1 Tax=Microbispora hainanensis TaxID=568844 RepID=UPI0033D71C1B